MDIKRIEVGEEGVAFMPWSEVAVLMGVNGKNMRFRLVTEHSVQLLNEDGTLFSSPITTGEAGLMHDSEGLYYYPDANVAVMQLAGELP